MATGYEWGARELVPHMRRILDQVRDQKDERMEQLAGRFLAAADRSDR